MHKDSLDLLHCILVKTKDTFWFFFPWDLIYHIQECSKNCNTLNIYIYIVQICTYTERECCWPWKDIYISPEYIHIYSVSPYFFSISTKHFKKTIDLINKRFDSPLCFATFKFQRKQKFPMWCVLHVDVRWIGHGNYHHWLQGVDSAGCSSLWASVHSPDMVC